MYSYVYNMKYICACPYHKSYISESAAGWMIDPLIMYVSDSLIGWKLGFEKSDISYTEDWILRYSTQNTIQ